MTWPTAASDVLGATVLLLQNTLCSQSVAQAPVPTHVQSASAQQTELPAGEDVHTNLPAVEPLTFPDQNERASCTVDAREGWKTQLCASLLQLKESRRKSPESQTLQQKVNTFLLANLSGRRHGCSTKYPLHCTRM